MKSKEVLKDIIHNRNNHSKQSSLINVLKITSFAGLFSKLVVFF